MSQVEPDETATAAGNTAGALPVPEPNGAGSSAMTHAAGLAGPSSAGPSSQMLAQPAAADLTAVLGPAAGRPFMPSPQQQQQPSFKPGSAGRRPPSTSGSAESKMCNCRNSKCLKLYCECFASGRYCGNCNCVNCMNNTSNEAARSAAIELILERNPNAFRPKIQFQQVRTRLLAYQLSLCQLSTASVG